MVIALEVIVHVERMGRDTQKGMGKTQDRVTHGCRQPANLRRLEIALQTIDDSIVNRAVQLKHDDQHQKLADAAWTLLRRTDVALVEQCERFVFRLESCFRNGAAFVANEPGATVGDMAVDASAELVNPGILISQPSGATYLMPMRIRT